MLENILDTVDDQYNTDRLARRMSQEEATDHIYRLMEGDGNQSRINDGQPSAS